MTQGWPRRTRLGDHTTWRPEWTSGRPLLWWYLTFGHLPRVAEHSTRAAAALGPLEQVDVPPREWLHLTLCEVGFRDEVDESQVKEGAWAVAEALQEAAPVELRLGPVNSLYDAVVLEAHPMDGLRGLRATVRGAMATAGLRKAQPGEAQFWPHVTIGYLNAPADHRALMDSIGSTGLTTTSVTADRLELVEVTRADRHYRWRTRASLSLGRALVPRG
ncbi:MAG TPA: 2'-5' RNA ligase family protein [Marmoricola sp.]|nr:2'-5' RNA ligase family protein [Marmoricola sp.]